MKKIFIWLFLALIMPSATFSATINGDLTVKGKIFAGPLAEGQSVNCGINVSGSTFTIVQSDGNALSATRPCRIGIRSNTAGLLAEAKFTSPVSFTFGAASDTDGNLFGITDANWASVMPFNLSVIYDGTTPYFIISRVPSYVSGAAATALCQKGDTDCDAQVDSMILASGLTLANFVNLPITQVGWFQMTYATAGGAWTATTSVHTGFNYEYEKQPWTMPTGQQGASVGAYFLPNGGTAPVFNTNAYKYFVTRTGDVSVDYYFDDDGGTDGSGAVSLKMAVPYYAETAGLGSYISTGYTEYHNTEEYLTFILLSNHDNSVRFNRNTVSGTSLQNATTAIQNGDYINNNYRLFFGVFSYRAWR